MSFATITLCVASQQVFIAVIIYFITDSLQKLLDTPLYCYKGQIKERDVGNTICMGEVRNPYTTLVGKHEGNKPLGGPRHRWEHIKIYLR